MRVLDLSQAMKPIPQMKTQSHLWYACICAQMTNFLVHMSFSRSLRPCNKKSISFVKRRTHSRLRTCAYKLKRSRTSSASTTRGLELSLKMKTKIRPFQTKTRARPDRQ